jgi:hypothetical protein
MSTIGKGAGLSLAPPSPAPPKPVPPKPPTPAPTSTPSAPTDTSEISTEARSNVDVLTAVHGLPDLDAAYSDTAGENQPESGAPSEETGASDNFYKDWYPSAGPSSGEVNTSPPAESGSSPGTDEIIPSWDPKNPYGGEGGVNARNVTAQEWDGAGGNENDNLESIVSQSLGVDPAKLYEKLPDGTTLMDKVAEANGISDPNLIQPDQNLVVPTMDEVPPEQLQNRAIDGANRADESYASMNDQIDGLGLDDTQSQQLQESQYNQSFQSALEGNPEMKQQVDAAFAMQNGPEKTEALAKIQDQVNAWRGENPFQSQQADALGAVDWASSQDYGQEGVPDNVMGMVNTASQVSSTVGGTVNDIAGLGQTDPEGASSLFDDINTWTGDGKEVQPFDLPSARVAPGAEQGVPATSGVDELLSRLLPGYPMAS